MQHTHVSTTWYGFQDIVVKSLLILTLNKNSSVSYAIQVLKSKSASWLKKKTKRFPRGSLWARGYFVSTIGLNEDIVLNYIANQDHKRIDIDKARLF